MRSFKSYDIAPASTYDTIDPTYDHCVITNPDTTICNHGKWYNIHCMTLTVPSDQISSYAAL